MGGKGATRGCLVGLAATVLGCYLLLVVEILLSLEQRQKSRIDGWSLSPKYLKIGALDRDLLFLSASVSHRAASAWNFWQEVGHSKEVSTGQHGPEDWTNPLCDQGQAPSVEHPYFSDISHAIHGPKPDAGTFLNCTEIAIYLRSMGREERAESGERLMVFARRCMHCHKDKRRNERSFEKLRERYVKRNSLTGLQSSGIIRMLASRPPRDKLKRMNQDDFPVITIGLAVCGRYVESMKDYTLLTKGFPGYASHLETGFEYWFILGADIGDPLFDLPHFREQVHARFNTTVAATATRIGVCAQLKILRFANPAKKPGPAFNVVLGAGFLDGSDYFFRPNDDTVPVTHWAYNFVQALRSNNPSNFGVVGPEVLTDTGGNTRILTHDFVSRVHFEIFDTYYPISLADWMMDDWISSVYGPYHTCRLRNVKVNHTTLGQNDGNPRYKVDSRVNCLLPYEQFLANVAIHRWMAASGLSFQHGKRMPLSRIDKLELGLDEEKLMFQQAEEAAD